MKLTTEIGGVKFTTESHKKIFATKVGKTGKANKMVKMEASNDRAFNEIASRCDQGANRLADRKAKRQAAYEARQK